ncbi:MAG: ABC transporter permease [Chloroflexi bacterium GWB2_49_20]|nr:MAG: ABC transporter permease [Chloroflexi bacterium GWB2_49_20]OGN78078.1 MAG: ABC transporter permease [Chloroflexi bacterium GWC2_49_37]OGN85116.1 MAG: ABC transporter permease [Chloroflexi bacterium GWD2_49_16]HBG74843.1 ABC transporter permease [Anaerolineae bacterium]HCC78431.1 ABC transporter permease [Anaerolineae bacterium]
MNDVFQLSVIAGILTSAIRLATPYLYAAIGETFSQRSGVVNLGVDGIMLIGAYASFYIVLITGNIWLGLLAAIIAGLLMGLLMSLISVTLKAEQGISGIGLYMFGLGLSSLLFKTTIGTVKTVTGFQSVKIPLLGDIPVVGKIFFDHSLLVYGAFLLIPLAWWVLEKTTWGLQIKSVGQNPAAADSLGVNVDRMRYTSVCIGAILAGIAGASLSISLLNLFQENLTAGQGFIAVALVYFGNWKPQGILWGALLFSTVNAFQLWMQVLGVKIPSDIAIMLPYVLTIAALAVATNRVRQPAALNKPFERGES